MYNVATQIEPRSSRARRSPRTGRGSSGRRATHQARIGPCTAPPVGIRTARNRPVTTKWRHTASGRVRLHTAPLHASGPLGDLHATNAPHTPLFNLAHFSRALAREQCARATAEAAPSRPKAALPAPSLKPSAAHGQIGRSPAEFARGGSSDQPRPQWAFGSDESTHQLSSIAQVHAMAAGCFHRLSAQPHRDAPPRAQSFPRP